MTKFSHLEETKLIRRIGRADDDSPDIANINITASDGQRYHGHYIVSQPSWEH